MGKYDIGFNAAGRFTTFPSVNVTINPDNLDLRPQTPLGVIAILAEGAGFFPPGVATSLPMHVASPQRFLSPSNLLTCAELGQRPFPQLDRGAGEVIVVPVNASTKSTKTMLDGSSDLLCTLNSKGWGTRFNATTVKSEAGKLTVSLPGAVSPLLEVYLYSTVAELVAAINNRSSILEAVFTAEGTPATFDTTEMTGGTEPSAETADWDTALHALDGRRITAVHCASPDAAVQAMLGAYAIDKRLRGFTGSPTVQNWNGINNRAAAVAALKAQSAALNAFRMMNCGLGCDGLPGYLYAARYAALAGTLEPSMPMTFKHLDAQAIETRLDLGSEVGGVDGLLLYGVAVPVPDPTAPGTFIVSRGLSTWTGDSNLYRREHSVLAGSDAIQDLMESGLRTFLGGEGTISVLKRAESVVDQILNDATRPGAVIRIVSYRREAIKASFSSSDTVLRIAAAFTPIVPINFIQCDLNLERTEIELSFNVNLAA